MASFKSLTLNGTLSCKSVTVNGALTASTTLIYCRNTPSSNNHALRTMDVFPEYTSAGAMGTTSDITIFEFDDNVAFQCVEVLVSVIDYMQGYTNTKRWYVGHTGLNADFQNQNRYSPLMSDYSASYQNGTVSLVLSANTLKLRLAHTNMAPLSVEYRCRLIGTGTDYQPYD